GGLGVDTAPMIVNGTIYMVTQANQAFALNAANGNVLWTTVLPVNASGPAGNAGLHLHNGNAQFTTKLFNHTPTFWIAAGDRKEYALKALMRKVGLNFSVYIKPSTVPGNNPVAVGSGVSNLLVDQSKGILISSVESG